MSYLSTMKRRRLFKEVEGLRLGQGSQEPFLRANEGPEVPMYSSVIHS